MRNLLTTLLEVAGLTMVSVGAGLVYVPAGVIAGGASMVLVGFLAGRS